MRIDPLHVAPACGPAAPAGGGRPAPRARRRSAARARAAGRSCGGCCRRSSSRSAARRSRRVPAVDGGEDVLEALAGHQLGVGGDLPRGRLAERSRFSLIGNAHDALPVRSDTATADTESTATRPKTKRAISPYRMMAPRGVVSSVLPSSGGPDDRNDDARRSRRRLGDAQRADVRRSAACARNYSRSRRTSQIETIYQTISNSNAFCAFT